MVIVMGRPYVKGGTPVGSESLCRTCTNSLIMTGYRESEMVAICRWPEPNITVPFAIYECSGYYDKNRPSYSEMQKFALHITNTKPRGFKVGAGFGEAATTKLVPGTGDEDEDED